MGHALSRAWNNLKHQIYCWVHSHCYISRLVVTDDTTLRNLLRPAAAVNAINSTLNGTNFPRPADTANHTNGTIYDTAGSGHHLLAKRAALMNLLEPGVAHSGMASEYGWLWIALFLIFVLGVIAILIGGVKLYRMLQRKARRREAVKGDLEGAGLLEPQGY
ncbi:MAG: hypothetical protein LQ346_007504 [Caloplaca aetnensis]|nr:MAG: hypothetical protein LQ346_007504 [Caloplaca aetnensis]